MFFVTNGNHSSFMIFMMAALVSGLSGGGRSGSSLARSVRRVQVEADVRVVVVPQLRERRPSGVSSFMKSRLMLMPCRCRGCQGTRANGQNININRDFMKLETPEGRAFVKLWNDYDPQVGFDLHTSDGSAEGYYLTYAPPSTRIPATPS